MRIAASLSALLIVLVLGLSVDTVRAADKESETIVRLEKEWITAFMKGDRGTVDRMETPTYTAADDEEGLETKAQQLKAMDERQKPDLGESLTPKKQDVRLFGEVALLTGLYDVKEGTEKPSQQMQVTELWVKQVGTWKVEHIQYAILKPTK